MKTVVCVVEYLNERHARDLEYLLNCYALDPMGGGVELEQDIRNTVASELAKLPHAFSILCYVDKQPAGLINCFEAFSTFKCKPLINVHDVIVAKQYRGLGISQLMLEKVEMIAKQKACCKITLEVLEGNEAARKAYTKFGFAGYELDPVMGKALFWQKNI